MERQYQAAVQIADYKNKSLESQAETMRLSILGKDSKAKDGKPLEVVSMLKSMGMVRCWSGWPWASHMAVWQAFL